MIKRLKQKKVLVTCGPTWIALDSVRVVSNLSSGVLGQMIAQTFAAQGAKVTLLEGPVADPLKGSKLTIKKFQYFEELDALLRKELSKPYDVCIHAAAVADYKPKYPKKTKLRSHCRSLQLNLVPTKKLIQYIRQLAPNIFLVGFKLEPGLTKRSAGGKTKRVFKDGQCNLVVANSVDNNTYTAFILDKHGKIYATRKSRLSLSKTLTRLVSQKI